MANILTDTGAPYVIAVAIGAVGWLVTTSMSELKQANITEYTTQKRTIGDASYVDFDFHNRSLAKSISSGNFTFRCLESTDASCFWNDDPVVSFTPLNGVSLKSEIDRVGPVYRAQARLAPQSGVRYTIRTTSPDSNILMFYEPTSAADVTSQNLVFRQGPSWEGWLIENYLSGLIYIFVSLVAVLALWVAASAVFFVSSFFRKRSSEPKQPTTFNIVLELRNGPDA